MKELIHNGKKYRCLKETNPGNKVGGTWELLLKEKWFPVRNWNIKAELNALLSL